MLDDLRDTATFEDDEKDYTYRAAPAPAKAPKRVLGMTPIQRFVLALMIFMMVCILGSFFLLITETIWLPV